MSAPYEFTGAYAGCYTCPPNCMDVRHVYTLCDILRTGVFRSALEVGCADGASSTAFVEAANHTEDLRVTFCDVRVSESLLSVANNLHQKSRGIVANCPSVKVLENPEQYGGPFDFVLLDGRHDLESVRDEVDLLARNKPLAVAGHDTSATLAGYPLAEGAEYLRREVQWGWGWYCIEDNLRRDGEETQRGLFFATPSLGVYRRARAAFRRWCYAQQGVCA